MSIKQINGFKVLSLKFNEKSSSYHEIFIKEHIVRNQSAEAPAERTLFVLNIPCYATEDSLKRIFSPAGPIDNVIFKKNYSDNDINEFGFRTAYVVFATPRGLLNALKLIELEQISTPNHPVLRGVNKWVKEYNQIRIDPKVMEKQINEFMAIYDKKMEEKQKEEKQVEDDEGWITVTKHNRKSGPAKKENAEQKVKEKLERIRQKKELKNFYTFQIRESKMKQLADLRKKFENDKMKIKSLKQARKFKPF